MPLNDQQVHDVQNLSEDQGCCCGHKHLLLTDTEAQVLRDASFLVENDTETV